MLTIRIHLDPADEFTGALRVLPGSHRLGRLNPEQIQEYRNQRVEHLCVASAGSCLLMRPLLLHASSRSTGGSHRRILHIEFADFDLPSPLRWNDGA
jgi:ectoine hydroxylase-related dioxygenase (phytanoyl-CoA dioxygenase family)